MENLISKKNILFEKELLESYVNNYEFTDSLRSHRQTIMVKTLEKNKKTCEDLALIDKEILEKEFKLCQHEPVDVANLMIEKDKDFQIKTKEIIKTSVTKICTDNTKNIKNCAETQKLNGNKVKEISNNEIIEIKCKPKLSDIRNENDMLHKEEVMLVRDELESKHTSQNDVVSNDLKRDLQSLLIMIAMSNTYSEKDCNKTNPEKQNEDLMGNQNCEDHMGNEIKKTVFAEKMNNNDNISNILKIEALKPAFHKSGILRKYAYKWLDYVKKRRESHIHSQRLATINNFFDRLEKRKVAINKAAEPNNKAKLQACDYNTYQHRYKVQKHIIALQKAKLEQQNRLIEELKYNKITEASRQSLDCMKEDVRQTYYEIDKHLKPKIKCLTNELNIREIEDTSLVLHCLKVPQFLQRMEARAREREEKHAMIRERRKQIEEERIRIKQESELAKAEMDREEKMRRIKELREKRRREKIENIRNKQYAERLKALIVMADLHYEKSLKIKYGIRPLKLLMEIKCDNVEKAKAHYRFQTKKNLFLHWMWHTEDMWYERNFKAEDFHRKKVLTNAFASLKENHKEYLLKMQVARDYYELYVTKLVFRGFKEGIVLLREEYNVKWKNAIIYYNSNLLFKTITCWRTLPALNALKREQDARKLRWRHKVLQVVPDYMPPED